MNRSWLVSLFLPILCLAVLLACGARGGYLYLWGWVVVLPALAGLALKRARTAGAVFTVLVTVIAASGWLWMGHQEALATRFQKVGFAINDACTEFSKAFQANNREKIETFVGSTKLATTTQEVEHNHAFSLQEWQAGGQSRTFQEWRESLPGLEQAAFKIHLLEVVAEDEARAQIRFELNSANRSDYGLLRCRFEKRESWRMVSAEVLRGRTVSGRPSFVDSNLDFKMSGDARLTPGESCDHPGCPGAPKLKFQMMRHAYGGCAAGDFDGDGHDDLFMASGGKAGLFRNKGDGSFEPSAALPELWHVNTGGFADLDNDGDQDFVACRYFGPNSLFENVGGRYEERPISDVMQVTCFSFFDYDNDGDLDLYLGRYLDAEVDIPDSFLYTRNGQPNRLLENQGGMKFVDVTERAGVGDVGLALSLAAADYDLDGDQDLYLANDFGRNVLYQNQGDGTFRDVALETNASAIGGSMSASWGDYDNDGRLDLYVSAIRSNQRWFAQPLTIKKILWKFVKEGNFGVKSPLVDDLKVRLGSDWTNIGNIALGGNSLLKGREGGFTEVASNHSTRPAGWYWSSGFFDLDNDSDLDILAVNGWISGKRKHDL